MSRVESRAGSISDARDGPIGEDKNGCDRFDSISDARDSRW